MNGLPGVVPTIGTTAVTRQAAATESKRLPQPIYLLLLGFVPIAIFM